jgi:hypothetical protein
LRLLHLHDLLLHLLRIDTEHCCPLRLLHSLNPLHFHLEIGDRIRTHWIISFRRYSVF